MKKTAVIVFDNFEEIEALTPVDILKRAGASVEMLSASAGTAVSGRSGIKIEANSLLKDRLFETFDAVVLSGGPGTYAVAENPELLEFLKRHFNIGKIVAAICAAPIVLQNAGILSGQKCTGHSSIMERLGECASEEGVVVSGSVVTSRGAGTAMDFSLKLAEMLEGEKAAAETAKSICLQKS
ncbi:MAG: DJ-1/PfpI family protein [Opitutales bacterium]|nr:DJ-1/PfpI family protein [Opitutales bacterium]